MLTNLNRMEGQEDLRIVEHLDAGLIQRPLAVKIFVLNDIHIRIRD